MFRSGKCLYRGHQIAAPSTPYSDSNVATIESPTREVEYLRLAVEQFWALKLQAGVDLLDIPLGGHAGPANASGAS